MHNLRVSTFNIYLYAPVNTTHLMNNDQLIAHLFERLCYPLSIEALNCLHSTQKTRCHFLTKEEITSQFIVGHYFLYDIYILYMHIHNIVKHFEISSFLFISMLYVSVSVQKKNAMKLNEYVRHLLFQLIL